MQELVEWAKVLNNPYFIGQSDIGVWDCLSRGTCHVIYLADACNSDVTYQHQSHDGNTTQLVCFANAPRDLCTTPSCIRN
jgi:hypothetical protein